jgi:hypothetical protein
MTKDSFIIFMLGVLFTMGLYICLMLYQGNLTMIKALAKPNECVYNIYQMPEDKKIKRGD